MSIVDQTAKKYPKDYDLHETPPASPEYAKLLIDKSVTDLSLKKR